MNTKSIKVRFISQHGNDIPGCGFFYARQPGANVHDESECAVTLAKAKAKMAGRTITEIIKHFDEVKIWVA